MDTFMDKLAQRLNAQEVIKANTAAEAAELSRLKEQNMQYEELLRQVREEGEKSALYVQRLEQGAARAEQSAVRAMQSAERLEEELGRMEQDTDKLGRSVLRTEQNTEKFELNVAKAEHSAEQIEQGAEKFLQSLSAAEQSTEKIERSAAQIENNAERLEGAATRTERGAGALEAAAARTEQSAAQMERGVERLEHNTEKTEALIESGMAKFAEMQAAGQNTEELNTLLSALKAAQAERFDQLTEHVHRENVKVYRNVQAVVVDENAKQNEAAGKNTSSMSDKLGVVLGVSVVALLVSAAGLAFQILVYLHII